MGENTANSLAEFWKSRFITHGHTGWADGFVYGFDQVCRQQVFSNWFQVNLPRHGRALDFGCGTGDFSRLLLKKGWGVTGYDKYVKPQIRHSQFHYADKLDESQEKQAQYDLVISITVLDCIVDDLEFASRLTYIGKALKPTGMFYFIEYSPQQVMPRSSYQAFRTLEQWRRALDIAGLSVGRITPFFHPYSAPVKAWEAYTSSLRSRVAKKLMSKGILREQCKRLLRGVAESCLRKYSYAAPVASPIHIITGQAR